MLRQKMLRLVGYRYISILFYFVDTIYISLTFYVYYFFVCVFSPQNNSPNLNDLAQQLADGICQRGFLEKRINMEEDYSLIGMLQLLTAVIKHKPPFSKSEEGRNFLKEAFQLLFALPSPEHRFYPKAKTQDARSAVYDLMVEMVRGNTANYRLLHAMVSKQHIRGGKIPPPSRKLLFLHACELNIFMLLI